MTAADWMAAIGSAFLIHAALLYWSFGFLTRFQKDGTPRDYMPGGRPEAIRNIARIFRRFSYGGTALAVCGGLTLGYHFMR